MARRLRKDLRCRLTAATKVRLKQEPWLRQQALHLGALLPRATLKPIAMQYIELFRTSGYEQSVYHGSYGPFWEEKNTEFRGAYLEAAVAVIDRVNDSSMALTLVELGAELPHVHLDVRLPPQSVASSTSPLQPSIEPESVNASVEAHVGIPGEDMHAELSRVEPADTSTEAQHEADEAIEVEQGSIRSMIPKNVFNMGS